MMVEVEVEVEEGVEVAVEMEMEEGVEVEEEDVHRCKKNIGIISRKSK